MKEYEAKDIRNIVLMGPVGTGKTSFSESILFQSGIINRKGTVEDRNTVSDFTEIEQEKGFSVFSALMNCEWKNTKINFIDTPGLDDFVGETLAAMQVADASVIFINGANSIEFQTNIIFERAKELKKPISFLVNNLDIENVDFDKIHNDLIGTFGSKAVAVQYPLNTGAGFSEIIDLLKMKLLKFSSDGKYIEDNIPTNFTDKANELRNQLIESIAETNEDLMLKYFDTGNLETEELIEGLKTAFLKSEIYPIFISSARLNIGVSSFLDNVVDYFPNASDIVYKTDSKEIQVNATLPTSLYIFKLYSDPKIGDLTYLKVITGKLSSGIELVNHKRSSTERFSQVYAVQGKKRDEVPTVQAGDICATVKLRNAKVGDTFHEKGFDVAYPDIVYPKQKIRIAVVPKTKGEEEKVGTSLHQIALEDPSIIVEHSPELKQTILYAQGDQQLQIIKWRLTNRFKVETEFIEPKVPYRETITKAARESYRHKKQTGGAGQFAEVHILIDPWYEGASNPSELTIRGRDLIDLNWGGKLEYVNCIVGGVIDQRFMPAILKGIMEKMEEGPLTGSFVRDVRVFVYDGKMHPVDSNEAAFKTAGRNAFKQAFVQAAPKILEPIYNVEIKIPEQYVGDIMSDLPSRRAVILGIDAEGKMQVIRAKMPQAELDKYYSALKSMTQAKGTFTYEFAEYQAVPPNVQQELIDKYSKQAQEEE